MESVKKFNGLNGVKLSREDLQELLILAKSEEQTHVYHRVKRILDTYPDESKFKCELQGSAYEAAPESLLHGLEYRREKDSPAALAKAVSSTEIYDMITRKLLNMIKNTNEKYKRKWEYRGYMIPFNFVSKKRYRGVNSLMLTEGEPLENPFFMTFKQVQERGGKVRKGAEGYEVVYFTKLHTVADYSRELKLTSFDIKKVTSFAQEHEISLEDIHQVPMIKYYKVFNGKDIEGIDFKLDKFTKGLVQNDIVASPKATMPVPEAIFANYPTPRPELVHKGQEAFYQSALDKITMPAVEKFDTIQDYYRTFFHEMSHSTGHRSRLARKLANPFGSPDYAFEELIAEFSATFLSAEAGIIWHNNANHAAYLKSWNSLLAIVENDNKFLMKASTQAQKAADFVLQFDEATGEPKYFADIVLEPKTVKSKKKSTSKAQPIAAKKTEKSKAVVPAPVAKQSHHKSKRKSKPADNRQLALFGAKPKGLKSPDVPCPDPQQTITAVVPEPETEPTAVEEQPEVKPEPTAPTVAKNLIPGSLAYKMAQPKAAHEHYKIIDPDIAGLLGEVEKKTKESVVITLAGGQGSMKTRALFRMMNAFAQNYRCGHASIEEHPDSKLYLDKVHLYLNEKARHNVIAPEIDTIDDLHKLIEQVDVIFIDSFAKLQEMQKGFEVDKDLRKRYDGKLFVIIFQLTSDGQMRGGTKSQFDGDIILMTEKFSDYKLNFIFANKNRYQNRSLDELKYNIYSGKLEQPKAELAPAGQTEKPQFSFKIIGT